MTFREYLKEEDNKICPKCRRDKIVYDYLNSLFTCKDCFTKGKIGELLVGYES